MRSMAAWSGLKVREAVTDFPPRVGEGNRHDYAAIDSEHSYWGDSVGVFQKPDGVPDVGAMLVRPVVRWWAHRTADIGPPERRRRRPAAPATTAETPTDTPSDRVAGLET